MPPLGNVPAQPSDAVHEFALLELQVKLDVPPGAMTEGLTPKVAVGMRLTAAVALALPPRPMQDSVYEVALATGPVLWLPLGASDPLHPPEAVHVVASVEVHVSIDDAPAATAAGDAVKITVGRASKLTVTATGSLTPDGPAHVSE